MNFSPKDPVAFTMYAVLLHKVKQYKNALEVYRMANKLLPNDMLTQYNMGLVLVELKKYKEAEEVAKVVYAAGIPLPGLKNKLIAANHWKSAPGEKVTRAAAPPKDPKAVVKQNQAEEQGIQLTTGEPQKPEQSKAVDANLTEAELAAVKAAMLQQANAEKVTETQASPATTQPELTAEQLADLKKAMREEATKKEKDPASVAGSGTPQPVLSEKQLADIKKAMLEDAANKKTSSDSEVP